LAGSIPVRLREGSSVRTPGATKNPWQWEAPALDVVCHAALDLKILLDGYEYEGRSHSLWFCHAETADEYAWYETAFMASPLIPRRGRQNPFPLAPGEASAKALWTGMAEYQVAWPFTRLSLEALDEFIDRWRLVRRCRSRPPHAPTHHAGEASEWDLAHR
jgi:eukaryotic-like serine/threonine-protein kinase